MKVALFANFCKTCSESSNVPHIIRDTIGTTTVKVKIWIISVKVTALIPPIEEYSTTITAAAKTA